MYHYEIFDGEGIVVDAGDCDGRKIEDADELFLSLGLVDEIIESTRDKMEPHCWSYSATVRSVNNEVYGLSVSIL